jgi:nucleoside-diphosphate-sugar epimerase
MLLDIEKIKKELGWRPEKSSREAVAATVKDLLKELFNT